MSGAAWKQQLQLMASGFLDSHWKEEWPNDDWEQDLSDFTKELDAAINDCWIEFRDRKDADRLAAVMDARPE